MKKRAVLFVFLIVFLLVSVNTVFAQRGSARGDTVTIRFSSPLPGSSEWGRALDRLAADWERVTGNQLRVVINHDGREGSEAMMLSKLRSDAIQVALLSSAGVSEICPAVMNLSIPFMIKSERELDLVLNEMKPVLESRVHNDFIVIAWAKGGWVYIFSKESVFTPNDLRRQRLSSSPEFREINFVFRTMGFQLVEADMTSLGVRLANGSVNAIYLIPPAIAPMQLHRSLGFMLDLPIAPVMGAIVMNRVTWNKISSAHQQEIIRVTQRLATDFDNSMARTEANAIAAMDRDGLTVNKANQAQESQWSAELENALPSLFGTVLDRDLYQRISNIVERARSGR